MGRPPKNVAGLSKAEPKQFKMKVKPNWEDMEATDDDTPDRLRINPNLVPEGMSLQWVTDSVLGQATPQHRADFEKRGWTPIHQEDFNGVYDGMFMPKGASGEINVEGLVLMARPTQLSEKAHNLDRRRANEQVHIKEASLRGGDLPIGLDSQHPSALRTNRINKTVERISIPDSE
jgi:hypothetical protein